MNEHELESSFAFPDDVKKAPSLTRMPLLACIALIIAVPILRCGAADSRNPMTLVEVHTWGDLLALKPVAVEDVKLDGYNNSPNGRPSFKIGIDRKNSKRYSATVVYCLVQGDTSQSGGWRFRDFGPFGIKVQRPDHVTRETDYGSVRFDPVARDGEAVLYMKTIPLDLVGDYSVLVQGLASAPAKGEPFVTIAVATVKVSEEPSTLWSPWVPPRNKSARWGEHPGCLIDVANPSGGIAVPQWQELAAVAIQKHPDVNRPLPELVPTAPDAGV